MNIDNPVLISAVCLFTGVGKSSLVHLLCQNQVLGNPSWTVGCSVDVRVQCQLEVIHFKSLSDKPKENYKVSPDSLHRFTTTEKALQKRRLSTLNSGMLEDLLAVPAVLKAPELCFTIQLMVKYQTQ